MLFRRKIADQGAQAVAGTQAGETSIARPKPKRRSWFEKRRERRKKRRLFEEILAWIFVPALIYGGYLAFKAVGGFPPATFDFFSEVMSMVMRGGK